MTQTRRHSALESVANVAAGYGEAPAGKTLDRIKVNSNYTPDNCRWATKLEQERNKRPRSGGYGYGPEE